MAGPIKLFLVFFYLFREKWHYSFEILKIYHKKGTKTKEIIKINNKQTILINTVVISAKILMIQYK